MSVLKRKRKPSQFEVFHHLYKMRKEITNFLLTDFGYSAKKAEKKIERQFGGKPYEDLSNDQQAHYDYIKRRNQSFEEWFVVDERETIISCLRNVGRCVFSANSIYPQYIEELIQRRLFQDEALGHLETLKQELQYAIEVLPVDINRYMRFSDMIDHEIGLVKAWRHSDNKFKKTVITIGATSDSAANFANVNNNGNANNNNASNTNGVRPDFDDAQDKSI